MAHYALVNSQNVVVQVITGVDETVTQVDTDGTSVGGSTEAWEQFYENQSWHNGLTCKRTSYNNNLIDGVSRGKYAAIGDTWNGTEFVTPPAPEPVEP